MIVVETRWGRIGACGQASHAFTDRAAAERHIAATLRRRGTAETRIGVAYKAIAVVGDETESVKRRDAAVGLGLLG